MIDLHCHVLPGIDDGPANMDETLALARVAVELGTATIVATPHVSWEYPENDSTRIAAACTEVNDALRAAAIDLEVRPGAEVAMTRAGDLDDAELVALRLGGGPYLLLEPPFSPAAAGFDAIIEGLTARGHRLVLAHPERCPAFLRDRARLERYIAAGVLTSVTAGSLAGRFGRDIKEFSLAMLRDGLVHDIASDAHGASSRRPPGMAAELADAGWGEATDYFTRAVPLAILDGTPLPAAPAPPPKRGFLSRLRRA